MRERAPVSIVIPTYGREQVLIQTLRDLLSLEVMASEIVVVDQTAQHEPDTTAALQSFVTSGDIKLVKRSAPSIPAAMNAGLLIATQRSVLFLDDDIRPDANLVAEHTRAAEQYGPAVLVAGRVVQPWEVGVTLPEDGQFRFAGSSGRWISEFMGGNFLIDRQGAIAAGGFDENFVRVAYRFEAEFAHRWRSSGGQIRFVPEASLDHLKVGGGGTRTFGQHLTTWGPDHSVGAYYYALITGNWREFCQRPLRSIATRFHLRRPWRILPTLVAEARGATWAIRLRRVGPRRLGSGSQDAD